MKARWRILQRRIDFNADKTDKVFRMCGCLYNMWMVDTGRDKYGTLQEHWKEAAVGLDKQRAAADAGASAAVAGYGFVGRRFDGVYDAGEVEEVEGFVDRRAALVSHYHYMAKQKRLKWLVPWSEGIVMSDAEGGATSSCHWCGEPGHNMDACGHYDDFLDAQA